MASKKGIRKYSFPLKHLSCKSQGDSEIRVSKLLDLCVCGFARPGPVDFQHCEVSAVDGE
ncbi:hypothetical protein AKJ16_DCAP25985 [Drosera capensis]